MVEIHPHTCLIVFLWKTRCGTSFDIKLNKAFEEIRGLKPLLEEIAKVIDKPNQKKDTVRNWLKFLGLDNAVSPRQCQAVGRLIADWLKLGGMENYIQTSKPAKYSEAFVPLVKFAAEYQLFHAN